MSNHSYASASAGGGGPVGVVLPPNSHLPQHPQQPGGLPQSVAVRRNLQRHHFVVELSQCLFDFVVQLLPTPEELAIKEDVRKLLERLIRNIEPESRLLSFGSTANGFALRNSDMDLCCLIDSEQQPPSASELVVMVGDLLERETKFEVKPLPKARIPIIKLSLAPTAGLPCGIACDIGFENRLALENTRLLLSYATVDPTRVRTMVLFLKVWSKRRKINSPYLGTLSSYGYALMVIFFLIHVKNPPVLPNLQAIPPLRPISHDDMHIGEHNIWFFDDTELLKQQWQSTNTESVGELLIDFFRYYSHDFPYNHGVLSIRAGLLDKGQKGWFEPDPRGHDLSRDRNRLCIEDPFETSYNVGRTVTKDGLYTIRGEFMRAARLVTGRADRAYMSLSQLCEEREEELVRAPTPNHGYNNTHVGSFAAQSPYTVGTHFWRPNGTDRLSPPHQSNRVLEPEQEQVPEAATVPSHMAPKRQRWTSPPPPDAPVFEQEMYRKHFGIGISLATSSITAREPVEPATSSGDSAHGEDHVDVRSDQAVSPTLSDTAPGAGPGNNRWKRQSASFGHASTLDTPAEQPPRFPRSNRISPTAGPGQSTSPVIPTAPAAFSVSPTTKQTAWRGRPVTRTDQVSVPVPSNPPPPSSYAGKVSGGSSGYISSTQAENIRRSFSGPPSIRMPPIATVAGPSTMPLTPPGVAPHSPVLTTTQRSPTATNHPNAMNAMNDGEISPSSMSSGNSSPVSNRRMMQQQPFAQLRPQAFPLYQSQTPTSSPPQVPVSDSGAHAHVAAYAHVVGNGLSQEEKLAKEMSQLDLKNAKEKEKEKEGKENGFVPKEKER